MQKRAFERIPVGLEAKFFSGNGIYKGIVKDVSKKGMFINTSTCFPFDTLFEILIPLKEKELRVPVRVVRIVKTDGFYEGMGVDLMNPPSDYMEFFNRLKSNLPH
jgi:hypothetical protein